MKLIQGLAVSASVFVALSASGSRAAYLTCAEQFSPNVAAQAVQRQKLIVDLAKPLPGFYKNARAIQPTLDHINTWLAPYLPIPDRVRLQFYDQLGQAMGATQRIWANKSVLENGWNKAHETIFIHEYGHLLFLAKMVHESKFLPKGPRSWDPDYFFKSAMDAEFKLEPVLEGIEAAVHAPELSVEGPGSDSIQQRFLEENLAPLLRIVGPLRQATQSIRGFDHVAYEISWFQKSKANQEVISDLLAVLVQKNPQAMSKLFPGTMDEVVRNFNPNETVYENLINSKEYKAEAKTDPHIQSLLRRQIYIEFYENPVGGKSRKMGEDPGYDAAVLTTTLNAMSPGRVGIDLTNPKWPPGAPSLAALMMLKYKQHVLEENFAQLIERWIEEEPWEYRFLRERDSRMEKLDRIVRTLRQERAKERGLESSGSRETVPAFNIPSRTRSSGSGH